MRARTVSAVVLGACLAMGMAGCGDDDDEATTAGGGGQTTTTAATAAPTSAAVTTTSPSARVTVATANSPLGTILVDTAGKTLYTFDRDVGGRSACTGNCAATWPPVLAGTGPPEAGPGVGTLTVVARPDDATKMQVVWNGKPLYTFAADAGPGETKGDGVGGTWHVAKPA